MDIDVDDLYRKITMPEFIYDINILTVAQLMDADDCCIILMDMPRKTNLLDLINYINACNLKVVNWDSTDESWAITKTSTITMTVYYGKNEELMHGGEFSSDKILNYLSLFFPSKK